MNIKNTEENYFNTPVLFPFLKLIYEIKWTACFGFFMYPWMG